MIWPQIPLTKICLFRIRGMEQDDRACWNEGLASLGKCSHWTPHWHRHHLDSNCLAAQVIIIMNKPFLLSLIKDIATEKVSQWKGINRKQSTRWQHLSQLKASAFFSLQNIFSCYEPQQLILGTGAAIWWVTQPHLSYTWNQFTTKNLFLRTKKGIFWTLQKSLNYKNICIIALLMINKFVMFIFSVLPSIGFFVLGNDEVFHFNCFKYCLFDKFNFTIRCNFNIFLLFNSRLDGSWLLFQWWMQTIFVSVSWKVYHDFAKKTSLMQGAWKLTGENLKVVWAKFSTLI